MKSMNDTDNFYTEISSVNELINSIYSTKILLDFYSGTYTTIESSAELSFLYKTGTYHTLAQDYANHCVCDEHRQYFLDFFDEENLIAALTKTSSFLELEFRRIIHGRSGWMRFVVIPSGFESPIHYATLACNEITRQKEEELISQQALRDAFAAAKRANEAKTEFLSNMSHDIRTPMNAILGMALLAGTHIHDQSYVLNCLNKINTAGKHLLSLINDILDMSKIESGQSVLSQEEFCLGDAFDEIFSIITPEIKKKSLSFSFLSNGIENDIVIGDRLRLKQILINLLSNSCKYTKEKGAISFHVSKSSMNSLTSYEFLIKDNGIGMSEEFLSKIFQPFTRDNNHEAIEGSGLGLAIAHNLILLMNGTISVDSQVGKGSTFIITLPLISVSCTKPFQKESCTFTTSEIGHTRSFHFLLVDDNDMNLEVGKELLQMNNGTVETAHDGKEAITLFSSHPAGYFDAIFMDIKMPGMNGYDATMQIRKLTALKGDSIPIIAMTANAFSEDISIAKSHGMTDHLSKPIDLMALQRIINHL